MERGLDRFVVQAGACRGVGGLAGEQVPERLVEAVAGDLFVGDVDVAEDGLVQAASHFVGGVLVELVGVLEQGEAGFEKECALAEVEFGADLTSAAAATMNATVKTENSEATAKRFGPALAALFLLDQHAASDRARERLGWKTAHPSLMDELKAGYLHVPDDALWE